ncbi:tail fiber domain-containing protein, partial [Candidatus Nomurabacteria bacterium]|nr:tail fiber domain-containing protein [Candidatus Nomurabacteria bacterium]
ETLKDIQGTYTSGLDSLRNINPIAYSWKQDSGMYDNGIVYYGFSAQNVQASLPQAVSTSSNNKLQISQLTLLASSINAIKELDIKVQSLPTFDNPTLATKVAEFLRGIAEGVANIGRVNTDTLCVGNTCVTESQLQQLLQQASVGNNNSTPPPQETCSDGIMNQDETGIDEGGVCAPQVDPEPTPDPTCSDGILNQDETEIDIGGVCTPVEPTP